MTKYPQNTKSTWWWNTTCRTVLYPEHRYDPYLLKIERKGLHILDFIEPSEAFDGYPAAWQIIKNLFPWPSVIALERLPMGGCFICGHYFICVAASSQKWKLERVGWESLQIFLITVIVPICLLDIFSLIFNVFVCRDPDYEADKWVHHLAKYEYKVEIEFVDPNKPVVPPSATSPESPEPQSPHTPPTHADEDSSSDSSSSDEE